MKGGDRTKERGRWGGIDDGGRRMEHQLMMMEEEWSTN
jgi:hypothetical protein